VNKIAMLLLPALLVELAPANDAIDGGGTSTCTAKEFLDPRDKARYRLLQIGNACWFMDNLRFNATPSFCQEDHASSCARYGRLYPWETALAACPPGWHLSTEHDWQDLELTLGISKADLNLTRERGIPAGDRFRELHAAGIDVPYAGWRRPDGKYSSAGKATGFWTASESNRDLAWHRDINVARKGIYRSEVNKPYALSARCVKNYFENDPGWTP
jgi:uncharacterized protein (TIGR02145 family)